MSIMPVFEVAQIHFDAEEEASAPPKHWCYLPDYTASYNHNRLTDLHHETSDPTWGLYINCKFIPLNQLMSFDYT
jgi:hypothetical protein